LCLNGVALAENHSPQVIAELLSFFGFFSVAKTLSQREEFVILRLFVALQFLGENLIERHSFILGDKRHSFNRFALMLH